MNPRDVLLRHPENPILTPQEMPFPCYTVINTGAVRIGKEILLLLRVETMARETQFHVAKSIDGIHFTVNPEPIVYPLSETEKRMGAAHRFDMRITEIEGRYYVCHASLLGATGSCIGMGVTDDFITFEPFPYLSEPCNRNAALFPEKIGGYYVRLDRPQNFTKAGQIWVSKSPDLRFWGDSMPLAMPKTAWGCVKSGAGAVPIKTEYGWLEIYHATCYTASTENYYLGAMLLDLEDPSKVVAAPKQFILAAEEPYECVGQTPNVVFTNGAVVLGDGTVNVYYGGADTRVCLAQTTVQRLTAFCLEG